MRKALLTCLGLMLGLQWWQPVQAAPVFQIAGVLSNSVSLPPLTIQQTSVNDPLFFSQTYLQRISVPPAWDVTTGNSVPIAVIDTGVDLTQEDLSGRLWINSDEIPSNGIDDDHNGYVDDYNGFNFVQHNANLADSHGHGTGIASIIAATANNSRGMVGINWSAPIMVLRALDSMGGGDFPTVIEALRYAVNNGARVVNMSFGSVDNDSSLATAIDYAISKNVIVVAAVGNNHSSSIFYPAAYPNVIAVSALDNNNQLSSFSNFGTGTDLAAPGENIVMAGLSTGGVSRYITGTGSSFSSAEVAGVVSLLVARYPDLTVAQADAILKSTADKLANDPTGQYFGAGRVNALAALTYRPRTLNANVTLSNNNVSADGISPITVTAKIFDDLGQPQIGTTVDATISGSANIINNALVPEGAVAHLGTTDSQGLINFVITSTYPETKRISLFVGANLINYLGCNSGLIFKPVSRPQYLMQWLRQSPTATVALGDTTTLWVEVKNIGNVVWVSDRKSTTNRGNTRLGTARPLDRDSSFYDNGSWPSRNRASFMTPEVVRPSEVARFTFVIQANQAGNFREYFRPVIDYLGWLNDLGVYWDVRVTNPNQLDSGALLNSFTSTNPSEYSGDIRGKTNDVTLSPNQTAGFWIDLVNTGSAAWMSSGNNLQGTGAVRLGTAMAHDRTSAIYHSSWLSSNRVIGVGSTTSPNATLELSFSIKAPPVAGVYRENFQLVSEYVGWFGPIFGWTVTVK